MVIVFNAKKDKYCSSKKYLPKYGYSLYLPRKQYSGDGIGEIFNWLSANSGVIKDLTTAGSNTIQSLAKTAIDTTRGIAEIRNLRLANVERLIPPALKPLTETAFRIGLKPLTELAQDKILASIPDRKAGEGFKIIR